MGLVFTISVIPDKFDGVHRGHRILIDRIKDEGDKASTCHFDTGALICRGVLAGHAVPAGNQDGGPALQVARLGRSIDKPGHEESRPTFENDAVDAIVAHIHRSNRPRVQRSPYGITAERRLGTGAQFLPPLIQSRRSGHVKPKTISLGIRTGKTVKGRAISAILCIRKDRLLADIGDKRLRNFRMHNDGGKREQRTDDVLSGLPAFHG